MKIFRKFDRYLANRPIFSVALLWVSFSISLLIYFGYPFAWGLSADTESIIAFLFIALPLALTPLALWSAAGYIREGYLKATLLYFVIALGILSFLFSPFFLLVLKLYANDELPRVWRFWYVFFSPALSILGFIQIIRSMYLRKRKR